MCFVNPARHPPRRARPPSRIARRREIDLSSVVAEGAKEEATKKPLRREAGKAEMESDENCIIGGVERNVPMNALTVTEPANVDAICSRILTIRGVQVMLDRDLAELYGVPTKRLNEQVKRNARRFPDNFMFQLTKEELGDWRSQIATSNVGDGTGRSHLATVNSENLRSQIATSNNGAETGLDV